MNNAIFKLSDKKADNINGQAINPDWWSRVYEYPWAMQFAKPGMVAADIGCGRWPRPLSPALAQVVKKVYAVDAHKDVLTLPSCPKVSYFVGDMTKKIEAIKTNSVDLVYCISVLEDLNNDLAVSALQEFKRMVKKSGKIVLTIDTQYDYDKPLGQYPGLELSRFMAYVKSAGLQFVGDIDTDKTKAVVNHVFNLCVFHCVLEVA